MKIAVLYQDHRAPKIDGISKPMRRGGYRDSGTDIAVELKRMGVQIILPIEFPDPIINELDWVFPDTKAGIEAAINKGADTFWLNTSLYVGHPIQEYIDKGYTIIGQDPNDVTKDDNKLDTNNFLADNGLPAVKEIVVAGPDDYTGPYPAILKPIRGRGSQGVLVVHDQEEFEEELNALIATGLYGVHMMIEPFLPGKEVTLTVFPKGEYPSGKHETAWCLPPVERFAHDRGLAPVSEKEAMIHSGRVVEIDANLKKLMDDCAKAFELLKLKGIIRIDCRQDEDGNYIMFDLNMKPNMNMATRLNRENMDSLVMIGATALGWDHEALLKHIMATAWKK